MYILVFYKIETSLNITISDIKM